MFHDLASRTTPEATSLLRFLANGPARDASLADHVRPLASDVGGSPRLAAGALVALGAMGASDALKATVELWREGKHVTPQLAQRALGPALAKCGLACSPLLRSMAQHQDPAQRLSALYAVTFTKDTQTKAVLMQAIRSGLPSELTGIERDQLAYLTRN